MRPQIDTVAPDADTLERVRALMRTPRGDIGPGASL